MTRVSGRIEDSAIFRWSVLLTISFVIFSSYYFYDVFTGIKEILLVSLNFDNTDYGIMLGSYSVLNTILVMTIIGGIILDKWGIRNTGILFTFFMLIGGLLTYYGTSELYRNHGMGYAFMSSFADKYSPELKMMILGRMFFGLGSETVIVISSKVIVKWFKGKELALAFGVNLAIARIGQISALWLSPLMERKILWSTAGYLGAIIVTTGFFIYFIYCYFDYKMDRQPVFIKDPANEEEEVFRYKDLLELFRNKSFLYITALCVLFYSAVFPFLQYAPDFLHNKFGMEMENASRIASIIPFGTVFLTPFFGWLVDKKGKSATLMIIGSFVLIFVHLTLSLTTLFPYIPLFLLGIAFSLIPAAMWPAVAKIVKYSTLGTAYGLMTTIQNIGLMLFPWLIGLVLDKTNPGITPLMVKEGIANYNYTYAVFMLAIAGLAGLLFAYRLKREDHKAGFGLELPSGAN